ncbi:MAG: hypothetical protein ABJE95_39930 [Byssovorax sp.]
MPLSILLLAGSARADGTPSAEAARAETLFQEGKKLLEQSSFEAACPRLALSDELDPTISTLGLLAACHEQQGRIATAFQEYRATQKRAEAAGDPRADFARQRAAALEPTLPRIFIHFEQPSPGAQVLRNLEVVSADRIGVDVPIDPGAYEIVVRAPNKEPYRISITAKEGARLDVLIPVLLPLGSPPRAAPQASLIAPDSAPPKATLVAPPAAPPPGNPRLPAAAAAGAVGLIGLGVGVAFGIAAINKNLESTTLHETCKTAASCAAGADARSGAFTSATVSTVGFGFGIAGLAAGALLLLLPSSKSSPPAAGAASMRVTPLAGAAGGGALVSGSF